MFDKPQATHTLGLDLDGSSVKGVALTLVRGNVRLESAFEFSVEPASSDADAVKPLYIGNQKQQLDALAHKNLVVTALAASEVLVRSLEVKVKKEKDIGDILAFQVEPLLPYPIDNALIDKIVLSTDKEGSKLTILAVRKDHLAHHINQWNSLEIEPEDVSAAPAALSVFSQYALSAEKPVYAFHLGLENSFCIIANKGKLIAAQSISSGIDSLALGLAEDKQLNLSTAREDLFKHSTLPNEEDSPNLHRAIEALRLGLTRTIYALAKQAKGYEIHELLVTGEGANFKELMEALCRNLNKTLLVPQEISGFAMNSGELRKFAVSIGAALSVLPRSREQINFRQHEFAYPAPWKRLKRPLILYLILCFSIAVALILFGKSYLNYQEEALKRQYLELLSIMNKPYGLAEKEFESKFSPNRDMPSAEILPIASLTQEDMKNRLVFFEKELQSIPQFYPLQPNVPHVSDVLAWIATHPRSIGLPIGNTPPPALHIENFSYTMLKRPELAKKQEKYQVKVELEFSSPTPKMAREFHDALIEPNDIVDPKGEIKWSSNRDKYRTSFYVKDKTVYPGA